MGINKKEDANFNPNLDPIPVSPVQNAYIGTNAFRIWCKTRLPFLYDDELTTLEMIRKIIRHLNLISSDVNYLKEFFKDVDDYIDNFLSGVDVDGKIEAYLNKQVESGTLDNWLDNFTKDYKEKFEALANDLSSKYDELSNKISTDLTDIDNFKLDLSFFDKIQPKLKRRFRLLNSSFDGNEKTTKNFYRNQSLCVIDDNVMVVCDYDQTHATNNVKVSKIDINNDKVLAQVVLDLGHANDICYNDNTGLLYVAISSRYDDGTKKGGKQIGVIDPTNLTLVKYIDCDPSPLQIAYDKVTKKMYIRTADGVFLYDVDTNNKTFISSFSAISSDTNYEAVNNAMGVYNDVFYTLTANPNSIIVYDKDLVHYRSLRLDPYQDNFMIGELEGIDFTSSGKMWLSSSIHMSSFFKYNFTNVWTLDVYDSIPNFFDTYDSYTNYRPIYVSKSYKGYKSDGSKDRPFNNIDELSIACQSYKKPVRVTFDGDDLDFSKEGVLYLTGIDTVIILGNGATVGCAYIYANNNIAIYSLNFKHYYSYSNALVTLNNTGMCYFSACKFNNKGDSEENYTLKANESKLVFESNCTFDSSFKGKQIYNTSSAKVESSANFYEEMYSNNGYSAPNGTISCNVKGGETFTFADSFTYSIGHRAFTMLAFKVYLTNFVVNDVASETKFQYSTVVVPLSKADYDDVLNADKVLYATQSCLVNISGKHFVGNYTFQITKNGFTVSPSGWHQLAGEVDTMTCDFIVERMTWL